VVSSLPPLATVDDATGYGYSLPPDRAGGLLARASARIRRAALQPITQTDVALSLVPVHDHLHGHRAPCWHVVLPAPPIVSVEAVQTAPEDGAPPVEITGWRWDGDQRIILPGPVGRVTATYTRGFDPVPDGLVELCCEVADRLANTPDGEGLVRQQSIDDFSITYATEQIVAGGDLMPGEQAALARMLASPTVLVVKSRD
jgi:hypothetical protein